jgi:PilZ domain
VSTERFLKQRAVKIALGGHYTLPNWYDPEGRLRTFACRTNRISPYRMMVDVPVVGKVGDYLTSYFPDFGKLDGTISDTRPGCFLLELDVSYPMREKLAKKLTWLEGKLNDPQVFDRRQHPRVIPARSRSTLTLADGALHECNIIDMSVGGAAVSSQLPLEIGTPLAIGACVGRIVRAFAGGFAVEFVEVQNQYDLERLIIRDLPLFYASGARAASDSDDAEVEPIDA